MSNNQHETGTGHEQQHDINSKTYQEHHTKQLIIKMLSWKTRIIMQCISKTDFFKQPEHNYGSPKPEAM